MADEPRPIEQAAGLEPHHERPGDAIPTARPIPIPKPQPTPARGEDHALLLSSATRGSVWADMVAITLLVVAFDVAGSIAVRAVTAPSGLPDDVSLPALRRALFAPLLAGRLMAVSLSVTVLLRFRRQSLPSIAVVSSHSAINVLAGMAAVAVAYALIFAWQISVSYFWPGLWEQMSENAERIMALVPKPAHPIGFVPFALVVAVYEEVLFRGFLMTRLRRATGSWMLAVVISTVVFTSLHAADQTPAALVPVAILSVVFSLATIWRRSLLPAIVGHSLFNLFSFVGLYYFAGDKWL